MWAHGLKNTRSSVPSRQKASLWYAEDRGDRAWRMTARDYLMRSLSSCVFLAGNFVKRPIHII